MADELTVFKPTEHPLKRALTDAIREHEASRPRSLQTTIGPSGAGTECTRLLAYKMMAQPQPDASSSMSDPWAAIVGIAVHDWLAEALEGDNVRSGYTRWLVEKSVTIKLGTVDRGSCDAYWVDRRTVVDHKVPGTTNFKKYTKYGPSDIYRKQVHLYGYGYEQLGLTVDDVAIAFYPRSGRLSGVHIWSEPYDRQIALDTLDRADTVKALAENLGVREDPTQYKLIPMVPGDWCRYCDYHQPGIDTGYTCPGDMPS